MTIRANSSESPRPGPARRQAAILQALAEGGEASVAALARRFATSPETIRRDLTALANAGHIRKLHGRARLARPQSEGRFAARMGHNTPQKHLIAQKALKLVRPGQTLLMDTGSTTLISARALAALEGLTIITNSTRIAATFAEGPGGAKVFLLGGLYRGDNAQTIGPATCAEIAGFRADIALLTIGALNETGAMDFSHSEAMVARAMAASSARLILLADHSKLGTQAPFRLCPLSDIHSLITDTPPKPALAHALRQARVAVL